MAATHDLRQENRIEKAQWASHCAFLLPDEGQWGLAARPASAMLEVSVPVPFGAEPGRPTVKGACPTSPRAVRRRTGSVRRRSLTGAVILSA